MELFIDILEVILFGAKLAFTLSLIYFLACLGVWASDEYKEMRAERSTELARTSNLVPLIHAMVEEKREYTARHRFDKKQKQYRHEAAPVEASYLEKARTATRNKILPFGDEDFFAALLAEQKEFAPSW